MQQSPLISLVNDIENDRSLTPSLLSTRIRQSRRVIAWRSSGATESMGGGEGLLVATIVTRERVSDSV